MAVFEQLQIAALRRPRRPVMSRPFGTDDSRHSSRSSTSRSGRRWWAAAAAGAGAGAAAEGSLEQVALGNRNHQRTTILGFFFSPGSDDPSSQTNDVFQTMSRRNSEKKLTKFWYCFFSSYPKRIAYPQISTQLGCCFFKYRLHSWQSTWSMSCSQRVHLRDGAHGTNLTK